MVRIFSAMLYEVLTCVDHYVITKNNTLLLSEYVLLSRHHQLSFKLIYTKYLFYASKVDFDV